MSETISLGLDWAGRGWGRGQKGAGIRLSQTHENGRVWQRRYKAKVLARNRLTHPSCH